ncbi:MAG: triose-phosphate isomerase [Alphaproteobacteria bacterium]|nr:triose-phosphate isomerase [Alphaproteobacteria bacterium]
MTTRHRKLVAGNWKMNGLRDPSLALTGELIARATGVPPVCEVVICPPATLLANIARALDGSVIGLGGQDCHAATAGAHTGDISAEMLADAGCRYVIVGHSERRHNHGEKNALVAAKAAAALRAGLVPIICVGETLGERERGATLAVMGEQVVQSLPPPGGHCDIVVAYEPVWAIGSGRTPTAAEIAEVHRHIRACLASHLGRPQSDAVRLLYGGSVKADNARTILAVENVDGALVGGASLKVDEFWAIVGAAGS